jgi:hypothetical protein
MTSPADDIRRGEVRTHLHENYRTDVTDDYRDGWDHIFMRDTPTCGLRFWQLNNPHAYCKQVAGHTGPHG